MEVTDHSTHLKSVTEQAQGLINEIQELETQARNKRDMLLKLQGIIAVSYTHLRAHETS